LPLEKR